MSDDRAEWFARLKETMARGDLLFRTEPIEREAVYVCDSALALAFALEARRRAMTLAGLADRA